MKNYRFCLLLFLISTQCCFSAGLKQRYQAFLFKRACLTGNLQKVQSLLLQSGGVSTDQALRALRTLPMLNERQAAVYDAVRSLQILKACQEGNFELIYDYDGEGYPLWMGVQELAQLPVLTDQQKRIFEYIVAGLSVQDRSLLLKQVMKNPPHNQQIKDQRIGMLLDAGVVPYYGLGVFEQHRITMGLRIGTLWNRVPHNFAQRYAVCFDHSDNSIDDTRRHAEEKKQLACKLLTLIHFARSEKGGRSVHLRKYAPKKTDKNGTTTTNSYRVPSLRSCAFDAWAQGLSDEEVASLNELTIANRRV